MGWASGTIQDSSERSPGFDTYLHPLVPVSETLVIELANTQKVMTPSSSKIVDWLGVELQMFDIVEISKVYVANLASPLCVKIMILSKMKKKNIKFVLALIKIRSSKWGCQNKFHLTDKWIKFVRIFHVFLIIHVMQELITLANYMYKPLMSCHMLINIGGVGWGVGICTNTRVHLLGCSV